MGSRAGVGNILAAETGDADEDSRVFGGCGEHVLFGADGDLLAAKVEVDVGEVAGDLVAVARGSVQAG